MKPVRTWILIADAARARVLSSTGRTAKLAPVEGLSFDAEHGSTHEIMSDRQGRTQESHGHQRHAIEPRVDPHRALKSAFAARLGDMLDKQRQAGAFEYLVLVAPPVMLGEIRSALSDQVRPLVKAEIAKDLTRLPNQSIREHLRDALG